MYIIIASTCCFYQLWIICSDRCQTFKKQIAIRQIDVIVNTPTTRKKRQICQVTTQGYLKEYKLTVDASDVGVGALLLFLQH
jgi:hypothetical protein